MLSCYWTTPHLQTPPITAASIGRWTKISALIQDAQMKWCIILDIRFCKESSCCIALIRMRAAVRCNNAECRTRDVPQLCPEWTQWVMVHISSVRRTEQLSGVMIGLSQFWICMKFTEKRRTRHLISAHNGEYSQHISKVIIRVIN
jgi:hypothetical protein